MLRAAACNSIVGGRFCDTHVAEVTRASGAIVVVTDNRPRFLSSLRYWLRVDAPAAFLEALKGERG